MWEWLRAGKRIELVVFLLGFFSLLMVGIPAVVCCSNDPVFLATLIAGGVGCTLTLCVPTLFYLRWQRKKQSLMAVESHAAADHATALSRGPVYALMAAVTLMSAIYQAYRLDEAERPLGHSRASFFLWNFGILLFVVGLIEVLRRHNQKR